MNALSDWPGKADNLSISYDAGIQQTQLLIGGETFGYNLPAIAYPEIDNIRDVIAFPKTASANDLMSECPNEVSSKQLKELHIKVDF